MSNALYNLATTTYQRWRVEILAAIKAFFTSLCVLVGACGGGGGNTPTPAPVAASAAVVAPVSPLTFGEFSRLVSDTTKKEISCPAQTAQTMVAFVLGQSNAGNHSSHITKSDNPRIVNYFGGKCYIASDPLLGSTGPTGSQWIPMAQKLLGKYDTIIIIPFAVSGVSVKRFTGDLNPSFQTSMDQAKLSYNATHFLWHQGEQDAMYPIGQAAYAANLTTLINQTKAKFPASGFYPSIVSICETAPDLAIQAAQRSVADPANGVFLGVDSDSLGDLHRYDRCHFNEAGVEALATMWAAIL